MHVYTCTHKTRPASPITSSNNNKKNKKPGRSQRTLSFADELGRDLHEVHTAHNTQYSNKAYHRPAPVECCAVS